MPQVRRNGLPAYKRIQGAILKGAPESHGEDRQEYGLYFNRCGQRLQQLDTVK